MFQCDLDVNMKYFQGEYNAALNSDDLYLPDLPLAKSRISGGTMILWRKSLDAFVSIVPVSSSSFLPMVFSPPNHPISIHFSVYLPTAGKEWEFIDSLSKLTLCIEELNEKYPDALYYLRGDFNASSSNITRSSLLKQFAHDHKFILVPNKHKTYHHFTGGGASDSDLDQIMHSTNLEYPELLNLVICKLKNPLLESYHDLLSASWILLPAATTTMPADTISAPRLPNRRTKTGIEAFLSLKDSRNYGFPLRQPTHQSLFYSKPSTMS